MALNHWYTTAISWSWLADGMQLSMSTERPTHLACYWTLTPPVKIPFYRWVRGVRMFCGYTWRLLNTVQFIQNELGLCLDKTFTTSGWPVGAQAWWAMTGATADGPSESSSMIYTDTFPGISGPTYPTTPELVSLQGAIIRAGNHYTWASGADWYAVVPSSGSIRVFKRTPPTWTEQDTLFRPRALPGSFRGADSRLDSAGLIHIAYGWTNPVYPPNRIQYAIFDTSTDTWTLTDELVRNLSTGNLPGFHCSISVDQADKPHVLWSDRSGAWFNCRYSNKVAGAWSAAFSVFTWSFRAYYHTSLAHSIDDTLHCHVDQPSPRDLWYRSRSPLGVWAAAQLYDGFFLGAKHQSIDSRNNLPHAAYIDSPNTATFALGPAPWQHDLGLTVAPTSEPTIISPEPDPENRYLIYLNNTAQPAALLWDLGAWANFPINDLRTYLSLAATTVLDQGISYLAYDGTPPVGVYFNAWAL